MLVDLAAVFVVLLITIEAVVLIMLKRQVVKSEREKRELAEEYYARGKTLEVEPIPFLKFVKEMFEEDTNTTKGGEEMTRGEFMNEVSREVDTAKTKIPVCDTKRVLKVALDKIAQMNVKELSKILR